MADEAYRAVFLRVHPTGKMVLSLTTEPDGQEERYAQLVADELGVPPLDVKVVPADTNRFGTGHSFNTSPSGGTRAAIAGRPPRSAPRPSCWRARPGDARPTGCGGSTAPSRPTVLAPQPQTIADVALYAHCTVALLPGVEGGLGGAVRLRRLMPRRMASTSSAPRTAPSPCRRAVRARPPSPGVT